MGGIRDSRGGVSGLVVAGFLVAGSVVAGSAASIALLSAGGCTSAHRTELAVDTLDAIEAAESMELFALHPYPRSEEGTVENGQPSFHGYRILGRSKLDTRDQAAELSRLVLKGIRASDGMVAACFDPRHGIRLTGGGRSIDLLICYECLQMQVWDPTPELDSVTVFDDDAREQVLTHSKVEPEVSAIFEKAGLTIHGR